MTTVELCPSCGRPLYKRVGVTMPRLKAEMFDSIRNSGDIGITSHELHVMHYGDLPRTKESVIRSHIWQINDLLEGTVYRIRAEGRGRHARWMLCKASKRPAGMTRLWRTS